MNEGLFNLDLEIYAALGGGYLAYATACAGVRYRHKATDAAFITLAFGWLTLAIFRGVSELYPVDDAGNMPFYANLAGGLAGIVASVTLACAWRRGGRRAWLFLMRWAHVHGHDDAPSAIASIDERDDVTPSQITVHRKNGCSYNCSDIEGASKWPYGPYYLGQDGSVGLYATHALTDSGAEEIQTFAGARDPMYFVVPASEVSSIEFRFPTA